MTRQRSTLPDDPLADAGLLFALVRLVDLAARPFQEEIGRHHRLGLSEWRTLVALQARPASAASDVVRLTGLDKMSVSRALASLEAAGRIVRKPDPQDARRALASPTAAGRALLRALRAPAQARERAVTGTLGADERRQLPALVARLSAAAGDDGASEG